MTAPLWTPDANAQALEMSRAIEAAREDGRRQGMREARAFIVGYLGQAFEDYLDRGFGPHADAHVIDVIACTAEPCPHGRQHGLSCDPWKPCASVIETDSPADPDRAWAKRDCGE